MCARMLVDGADSRSLLQGLGDGSDNGGVAECRKDITAACPRCRFTHRSPARAASSACANNRCQGGEFTLDSIPTVGFNMKRVQRGHVTLKCWDIGGQPRFRNMWERYCRGVNAIVFIVDIAEPELIPQAKEELHALMSNQTLLEIPLLVLGNKSDLPQRMSVDELIDELDLKSIRDREVCCYGISAKEETNLDAVVQFLMKYANR